MTSVSLLRPRSAHRQPRAGRARKAVGIFSLGAYVAAIVAANWAIHRYGFVPVAVNDGAPTPVRGG